MLKNYPRLSLLLKWILNFYAVYLAYKCNKHEHVAIMILVCILAWFLWPYYLVYYAVYHWALRVPCVMSFGSSSVRIT